MRDASKSESAKIFLQISMNVLGGVIGGSLGAGIIVLPLALVCWLLWNHALAPLLGWHSAQYWQVVCVFWAAGVVSGIAQSWRHWLWYAPQARQRAGGSPIQVSSCPGEPCPERRDGAGKQESYS